MADSGRFEAGKLAGVVRQEADFFQSEMAQYCAAESIASGIGLEAQLMVRLDRVVAGILEFVGLEFVHQPYATSFRKLVNQDAVPFGGDPLESDFQLLAAVAAG